MNSLGHDETCSAESLASGEPLPGSAVTEGGVLCVEYRGHWERDVKGFALAPAERHALDAALASAPGTRLQFVRRTGLERDGAAVRAPGEHSADGAAPGSSRDGEHGPLALFAASFRGERGVRRLAIDDLAALGRVDLAGLLAGRAGEPRGGPLFLVCTHGRRDACCARHGAACYHALRHVLGADAVWETTHLGGHRFAATALELGSGLHYGRLRATEVEELAAAHAAGRIMRLDRLRGRAGRPPAVQFAEVWLRAELGVMAQAAFADGEIVAANTSPKASRAGDAGGGSAANDANDANDGGAVLRFVHEGAEHRVRVREERGATPRRASCGAAPEPWSSFAVVGHEVG